MNAAERGDPRYATIRHCRPGHRPAGHDRPRFTDADVLALEISGELLPPEEMVYRISRDLDAIRSSRAGRIAEVDQIHAAPEWLPGVIALQMTAEAWVDYQDGTFTGFDALNAQYGPVTIVPLCCDYTLRLDFTGLYNPEMLAFDYGQLPGIVYAETRRFSIAGISRDITSSKVGTYTFMRGWGDCPAGCIYKHFWEFKVVNGSVALVDEYGAPLPDTPQSAPPVLVGNSPNPFRGKTDIVYRVEGQTHVEIHIYDASGRLVRYLRDAVLPAGEYTVTWDGTNNAGYLVASGVYFCNMVANGVTRTRKMLVIR